MNIFTNLARPLMMGIVNVTPDSFSGDGVMDGGDFVQRAVAQAEQMLRDGADILDIGGESSRPGAAPISAAEEIRRTVPVIEGIRAGNKDVPISIDTIKAEVAEAALKAGANIVNDISALAGDVAMAPLVAKHQCPVILMHNRSRSDATQHDTRIGGEFRGAAYDNIIDDVKRDLSASVALAEKAGIARDKIILDPGIGFGKSLTQNMALIRDVGRIKELGFPVLLGPSRKSFIGKALDLTVDERLEGTAACIALGAFLGADILRVHDVKFMARVAKMASAIERSGG
jgi:dihydropteroate synthase